MTQIETPQGARAQRRRNILEILTAILLGLVSVATALGAYQATVWAAEAVEYSTAAEQLRDRNLSTLLSSQLGYRDDGAKLFQAVQLDGEITLFPDRTDELRAEQQRIIGTTTPELGAAWDLWVASGYTDEAFPLLNAQYEAASFAEPQSLQYASFVAERAADAIAARSTTVAAASAVLALALFVLGVAGIIRSWRVAAWLVAGGAVTAVIGVLVLLSA
ncbi:MAG: hypothetical protein LH471_00215 [Salinibacterium sp.]|nr:hypothetical protein [Salinibacterium sp.]